MSAAKYVLYGLSPLRKERLQTLFNTDFTSISTGDLTWTLLKESSHNTYSFMIGFQLCFDPHSNIKKAFNEEEHCIHINHINFMIS